MSLYTQKAQSCSTVVPYASEKLETAAEDGSSGTNCLIRVPQHGSIAKCTLLF